MRRRDFLKTAGFLGLSALGNRWPGEARAEGEFRPKVKVHPEIDDLLVVGVTDPSMTRGNEPHCNWQRQEELVVPQRVWENMDKMACGLSGLKDPDKAWRAIFIKPPAKPWSDVVVAIKTNNIALQHTRSAVISKLCRVFTDLLGVRAENIHIYDGIHGDGMAKSTPFSGLPLGVKIEDTWGGVTTPTSVPKPWKEGRGRSKCIAPLAEGKVDILVNIALCKGHNSRFGGFTMTMKNHFGTFSPRPGHQEGSEDYLIAINKTQEILGPMDAKTGKVLFPRQQLCVVDAIWASKGGPGGNPTHQPNFLAMGTFSPAVDYLVAKEFRGQRMGWKPQMDVTERFLKEFGYTPLDLSNNGKILEV